MSIYEKYASEGRKHVSGIGQYCPPACYELAGKRLVFVLDTGRDTGDAILDFIDETQVRWSIKGGCELKVDKYECRKADDRTYLVTYCLGGKTPRENHTWVLDMEQHLVTFLRSPMGENAYWPYLIENHFTFGYIKQEGKEHTDLRRHTFTDDLTGIGIKWVYSHDLYTYHAYHNSNWYRIFLPTGTSPREITSMGAGMDRMPSSDEPAYYIKIKESMYLISVIEQNMEKIYGEDIPKRRRSDTLCFLDNWDRMYSVGRGFGTYYDKDKGEEWDVYVIIGKYGVPVEMDEHCFTDPNPYTV